MNDPPIPQPAPPPSPKSRGLFVVFSEFFSGFIALVITASLVTSVIVYTGTFAPGPAQEATTLIIERGVSTRSIADELYQHHLIYDPLLFRLATHLLAANSLKAGEYAFTPHQSVAEIINMMHEGRMVVRKFTVAEGLTSAEIIKLMREQPALSGDINEIPPEGSLLPETYLYTYGDSRAGLISRMQKSMKALLEKLWQQRGMTPHLQSVEEAVVIASVVEKETGKPDERPRIAGVFYNRLQHKMRLQSDPTVIYGIIKAKGNMDHVIGHDDLSFPSPYNTYMNDGLPPLPICNPGKASLEAVLHPEENNYLYFVADGTGGHIFSHNLAEHNHNVGRWRQKQNHSRP